MRCILSSTGRIEMYDSYDEYYEDMEIFEREREWREEKADAEYEYEKEHGIDG